MCTVLFREEDPRTDVCSMCGGGGGSATNPCGMPARGAGIGPVEGLLDRGALAQASAPSVAALRVGVTAL